MQLIINVEKCAYKSIIGHRVSDALCDKAKVERLVGPTNEIVFKTYMYISNIDSHILNDDACKA